MSLRAARLAAGGGLAFAVSEFDRGHPRNGFARLGLAPPECLRTVTAASGASGRVINKGDDPRKRTLRVSASFGNNFPPSGG
jgi:hypothetical protein